MGGTSPTEALARPRNIVSTLPATELPLAFSGIWDTARVTPEPGGYKATANVKFRILSNESG